MFWQVISSFFPQLIVITGVALAVSVLELIGIGLIVPILGSLGTAGQSHFPAFLQSIADALNHLDVALRLRCIAGFLVVVYGLRGLMMYCSGVLAARLETQATNAYIQRCYEGILGAQMGYIHSLKGAYLYTVLRQNIGRFGHLVRMFGEAVPAMFTFVLLLSTLLLLSWRMTLLACAFSIFSSLAIQKLHKQAIKAAHNISQSNAALDATVLDTVHGLKTIHLFVRGRDMLAKFQSDIARWASSLVGSAKPQAATQPVFEVTSVCGIALLLFTGSFILTANGQGVVPIDILLTFLLVFFRLLPPVATINKMRVGIAGIIPICEEVQAFIERTYQHQAVNGSRTFTGLKSAIEWQDVSFRYNNEQDWVLKNVNLRIAKGMRLGIVGPSGAGKSTIAELLLRFYDPPQGRILIDGLDLKELDMYSWRRHVGVVSQDTFLFNDTIRANICFADPTAGQEQLEQAAKRAHIHDFIVGLPKGYDTVVGDRGVLLSGGQRQRLAIARAILNEPEILVFDEATSALDTHSEHSVQQALEEVGRGKTVISIAHRLSTVAGCDLIVVIEAGKIAEQGSHLQLLAKQGLYYKLAHRQSLVH